MAHFPGKQNNLVFVVFNLKHLTNLCTVAINIILFNFSCSALHLFCLILQFLILYLGPKGREEKRKKKRDYIGSMSDVS